MSAEPAWGGLDHHPWYKKNTYNIWRVWSLQPSNGTAHQQDQHPSPTLSHTIHH
jgi:hypothetical protein